MAIKDWSIIAANNGPLADGNPEGMLPSQVNDRDREEKASLRIWYETSEWTDFGYDYTRVSDSQFSVDGADYTAIYHVGRRVKLVGSTTVYSTIVAVVFGTNTVCTINNTRDGNVPASLTAVSVGAMSEINTSHPEPLVTGAKAGTQIVMLDTPESITFGTAGAWTAPTVTTLSNADAKAALIKVAVTVSTTTANSGSSQIEVHLRNADDTAGFAESNKVVVATCRKDAGFTNDALGESVGEMWVSLNASSQFSYYRRQTDPTGAATFGVTPVLLGYMK